MSAQGETEGANHLNGMLVGEIVSYVGRTCDACDSVKVLVEQQHVWPMKVGHCS